MNLQSRHSSPPVAIAIAAVLLLLASPAEAHVPSGGASGFSAGFSHPWSGWDHVLAMIAVGLWGAQLGKPAIWVLPVIFPMVMAMGGFLGLIGCPLGGVELGIGISALVLGLMVATERRLPIGIAGILVGIFGLYHGHAHGTELPEGQDGMSYSIGFVIATGCLHGVGIALGLIHRWHFGVPAIRIAGAAITIAGMFFTWRALA